MADKLTNEQIAFCKKTFSIFDTEKNGYIPTENLGKVIRILGFNPTKSELMDMKNKYNIDSDKIHFNDFLEAVYLKMNDTDSPEELQEAFKVFDYQNNGYITTTTLKVIINNLGENLSEEEVNEMVNEADVNDDGKIIFSDFINLIINT